MKNTFFSWIVLWTVTVTVPTGCPDFVPDPYTGKYPTTRCGVWHTETTERNMSKIFETSKQAQLFILNAPKYLIKKMRMEEQ